MSHLWRWTFTTLLFWLLLGVPARAGVIQVLIRVLPEGAPVEIIRVTLSNVRGGGSSVTATVRDERSVSFPQVRAGIYSIRAESPGFQTVESRVELNSFARTDTKLASLTLRKLDAPGSSGPSSGSTVSVKSLRVTQKARKEMAKARRASQAGKPQKAIQHLKQALRIHPEFFEAYNNLAVEYVRIGSLEEAIQALDKAIAIEPENAVGHRNLAELHLARGAFQKAIDALETSNRLQPGSAKTGMLLGEAHLGLDHYRIALDHFESARRIDDRHHSYLGMATCYFMLEQPARAIEELRIFLDKHPADPRVPTVRQVIVQLEKQLGRPESDPACSQ